MVTCHGRNVRINIPVTTPSRTVTAIRELLFEDMLSQSKKIGTHGTDGNEKLSINKRKVHQAEKMIRGALVELYKGLGYLKTYRYAYLILPYGLYFQLFLKWILTRRACLLQELEHDGLCEDPEEI
jgi:hypothetical protein